jgi:hypothetical protein
MCWGRAWRWITTTREGPSDGGGDSGRQQQHTTLNCTRRRQTMAAEQGSFDCILHCQHADGRVDGLRIYLWWHDIILKHLTAA